MVNQNESLQNEQIISEDRDREPELTFQEDVNRDNLIVEEILHLTAFLYWLKYADV